MVKPLMKAINRAIASRNSSLAVQFINKPLPFFKVKKVMDQMWSHYGKVEVFSLDSVLYIFRFNDALTRDEVLESQV